MRWSKNILEERESSDQITIGSMDSNFCVILALTLYLEHFVILNNQDSNPILFSVSKRRIHALFEEIMAQQDFPLSQSSNPIETHSICKLPAIYGRRNGCSKDVLMQEEDGNQTNISWIHLLIVWFHFLIQKFYQHYALEIQLSILLNKNLILTKL